MNYDTINVTGVQNVSYIFMGKSNLNVYSSSRLALIEAVALLPLKER